jgi:hypothetical protein
MQMYTTMKFLNFHLLQRESHLSSEESILSNQSQQVCEMLQFDSWGYKSVIGVTISSQLRSPCLSLESYIQD